MPEMKARRSTTRSPDPPAGGATGGSSGRGPVVRLMTSSNFVGCSTGRSDGLVPFRILSTKTGGERRGEEAAGQGPEESPPIQYGPSGWPRRLGGTGRGGQRVDLTPAGRRWGLGVGVGGPAGQVPLASPAPEQAPGETQRGVHGAGPQRVTCR